MHESLFVFDVETVPDTSVLPGLTGQSVPSDPKEAREALEQYHLGITDGRNAFPRQPFHKVVAVSFLRATIQRDGRVEAYDFEEVRSGGNEDSSEEELLKGFFAYCGKLRPRLVSYNGRGFDLPVLKYRAMKYGISAPWLHQAENKWENYNSRYAPHWHCDLQEVLSDYGASARVRLNEVCAAWGLPGKTGIDGGKVADMFDAGEVDAIRRYCETDVLNTYLVYLRWALHTGLTDEDGYHHSMALVLGHLEEMAGQVKAYADFWQAMEECGALEGLF
jgi:predicted PolB exonuclease-like 3'-5' exonuclease